MSVRRDERGQALVIVAATLTVLLGALALAVDWGYSLAIRRSLQNAADAAALGVGRTLATSTVVIGGVLRFMPSDARLWNRASALASANYGPATNVTLTLQYGDLTPTWTTSGGASSTSAVPNSTVYVRVAVSSTFRSFVAAVIGASAITASASARVRLSGAKTPLAPVIPFAMHFSSGMFSTTCPGVCGDPGTADPITLYPTNTYGSFLGTLDLSRYQHAEPTATQLVLDWDQTGSAGAGTPLKANHAGSSCPTANLLWDTAGNEDNPDQNDDCSIPNWYYHGYRGSVSVTTNYTAVALPQEAPRLYPPASQVWCTLTDASWQSTYGFTPNPRAACDRGDWAMYATAGFDARMSTSLRDRIAADGATGLLSSRIVPPGGPNPGASYGNALTLMVLLWDCGEDFTASAGVGSRWDLIFPSGSNNCTTPPSGSAAATPDRVHVLTVAPFTFYQGLVADGRLQGFWGGVLQAPPEGGPQPVWVFANTAYLVPDQ